MSIHTSFWLSMVLCARGLFSTITIFTLIEIKCSIKKWEAILILIYSIQAKHLGDPLEVIEKETLETLKTLNQKMNTIQNQVHQLQQAHQSRSPQTQ